jgi:hypothetical protein
MEWWWNLLAAMDAHEGQAAWAQAIGSVVAIVAAAWLAGAQSREALGREKRQRQVEDARRTEDRRALLQVAHILVKDAADLTRTFIEILERDPPADIPYSVATLNAFSRRSEAMRQIPLHQLHPVDAVPAFAAAMEQAQLTITYLRAAADAYEAAEISQRPRRLRASVVVLGQHLEDLEAAEEALRSLLTDRS